MKTVKIRIALAMNAEGTEWSAQGWSPYKEETSQVAQDERMLDSCIECVTSNTPIRRFIEVEVPLPEVPALQGTLVPEDNS